MAMAVPAKLYELLSRIQNLGIVSDRTTSIEV